MLQSVEGAEVVGRELPHQHSELYSVPAYLKPRARQLSAQLEGVLVLVEPLEVGRARMELSTKQPTDEMPEGREIEVEVEDAEDLVVDEAVDAVLLEEVMADELLEADVAVEVLLEKLLEVVEEMVEVEKVVEDAVLEETEVDVRAVVVEAVVLEAVVLDVALLEVAEVVVKKVVEEDEVTVTSLAPKTPPFWMAAPTLLFM